MIKYNDSFFTIFFGAQKNAYVPKELQGLTLREKDPFRTLFPELEQVVFLHQTHGVQGKIVREGDTELPSFVHDGDFLLTAQPGVGLGVSTADCLPVVLADTRTKAVAMVHAGWRGSRSGIVVEAIARMRDVFGTNPGNIQAFFGPSAQKCCYAVTSEFPVRDFVETRAHKLYFDNPGYVERQLRAVGVMQVNRQHNHCTICTPGYCSVRNAPDSTQRQFTVVALHRL